MMGTKNNPGKFDCYDKAEPDEPVFVLLARDPTAQQLVVRWADIAERAGVSAEKVAEARQCARDMGRWYVANRKPWLE